MIFDITKISQILMFDSIQEYESENFDHYSDTILSVISISEDNLVVYYGKRRLKNVIVDFSPPRLSEYPENKLYIQLELVQDDRKIFIKDIYYKYLKSIRDLKIATLDDNYLTVYLEPSEESFWTTTVSFSDGSDSTLLFADSSGRLSQLTVDSIKSSLEDRLKEEIGDLSGDIRWDNW